MSGMLSDGDSNWVATVTVDAQRSVDAAACEQHAYYLKMQRPSYIFRPRLRRRGPEWFAILGENSHDGIVGVGKSPEEAYADFDKAWTRKTNEAATQDGDGDRGVGSGA